jgi:LPPG:FO 2-phospho-L-lactate transferase
MGERLGAITGEVSKHFSVKARVLPMSDDRVRTFVKLRGRPPIPFQEYFVRGRARGNVEQIELRGIEEAIPAPGVIDAIKQARAVILAPSNPFVSLGPILQLKGVREALRSVRSRVAAISPIVGGKPIKGPADKMMRGLGHEVSPLGVAHLYQDFLGVFVFDTVDKRYLDPIRELGCKAVVTDTIMTTPAKAARLADVVLRSLEV